MTERVKVCLIHGAKLDASFCNVCGSHLIDEPTCSCGKTVSVFDQYCRACGESRESFRQALLELVQTLQEER
jgi:hypothetical protein